MNRKGFIQDILFVGVFLLVVAIALVIGGLLSDDLITDVMNHSDSTTAQEITSDLEARYDTVFDWVFFSIVIFMGVIVIASMFMLNTHPIMFFGVIIFFGMMLIVMGVMSNVYEDFSDTGAISTQASQMTVIDWIMSNFVIVMLGFGAVAIILMFAKMRVGMFR